MAAEFPTAGEQLLKRRLETEIVEGVPHFKPGQYDAVNYGEHVNYHDHSDINEIARLTYVDQMGHACVVVCVRPPGGGWRATWLGRAGQVTEEPAVRAPEGFRLSEKMLAALATARRETIPVGGAQVA